MKKHPLWIHHKTAKGRDYYYFDTGQKKDGRPILRPMPNIRSPEFGRAYSAAKAARTRRGNVGEIRSFDWLSRAYESSPDFKSLAEASKRLYSRHLGYAGDCFRSGDGKSWPLGIIRAEHVVALRDRYADKPGTANAILKALGALYHWAGKPGRRYVTENIARGVDMLDIAEHEPWPDGLIETALADPEVRLPVALLYFTGQRIGDAVKLGKGNVSNGLLCMTQQKTGMPLRIAMHHRLAEIIEADAPKDAMLFLVNERGAPLTASGVRQRIQKWAAGRGLHVVPHGLRKNAVNALLEAGCSTAEVSAITGQDLKTIEHYAKRRDREHLGRSAIYKLETRNKQRP